jgi:hypothetical protein
MQKAAQTIFFKDAKDEALVRFRCNDPIEQYTLAGSCQLCQNNGDSTTFVYKMIFCSYELQ